MAVTGWIEITYPVTDPVISYGRVGTDQTVVIHASDFRQRYETISHETRAGFVSETVHIVTLDVFDIVTPPIIRPGIGVDSEGASLTYNIREMLRSALQGSVMTLSPVGDHYAHRVPADVAVKLVGQSAGLIPDGIYPRFSLSMSLKQHGAVNSDY